MNRDELGKFTGREERVTPLIRVDDPYAPDPRTVLKLVRDPIMVCENCGTPDHALHVTQPGSTFEEYHEECTACGANAYNRSVFIPREEQRPNVG